MPMYDFKYLLTEEEAFTTDAYTTDVTDVNFGVTTPNVQKGDQFGLHIVITTAFTGLASGVIMWLIHGAATSPTTKHSGMFIPVAQLVAGAHFYIPAGSVPLLSFVRAHFDAVSEAATAGALTAWVGPPGPPGGQP